MSTLAEVRLWGRRIGAVSLPADQVVANFEYDREFATSGIEVAPLEMPLEQKIYSFPGLNPESFHGLPGLLSDSLPDRYGNALIDAWLAREGREPGSFDAVERLSYIGTRGMGALEFRPAIGPQSQGSEEIDVQALSELASDALEERTAWRESLGDEKAMQQILRVGTSAGGARAKALIAWNPRTGEVRSGQGDAEPGFEHWILKFDGVDDESRDLGKGQGYGAIEYVYSEMARRAGIAMSETRLYAEGGRRHFMTKRFDRTPGGGKLHMQSLAALRHLDFNQPGANSYEQAFGVIRRLRLGRTAIEQMFRRMVFNVVARNQDDHVKNIAFLMDQGGAWSLAPAFDMVYAVGRGWTSRHQMSINGMRDGFVMDDLREVAELAAMKRGEADRIVDEVVDAVGSWPTLADAEGLAPRVVERIAQQLRLDLAQRR
ncbi:MAG TPA: type II toxin-antitoxin system HipA family toxin [Solirubrobacterales bacterium]|nr:type II toxin-antitoxin system HipA family toxin [Solirubrobacterales bacterium]